MRQGPSACLLSVTEEMTSPVFALSLSSQQDETILRSKVPTHLWTSDCRDWDSAPAFPSNASAAPLVKARLSHYVCAKQVRRTMLG